MTQMISSQAARTPPARRALLRRIGRRNRSARPKPITILVCHAHALFRAGLRTIVTSDPALTIGGEADNGREALVLASRLEPDVVLVDDELPGLDAMQLAEKLSTLPGLRRPPRVVLLTDGDAQVAAAIRAGVHGLLLKDSDDIELRYAIRATAEFGAFVAPPLAARVLSMVGDGLPAAVQPEVAMLTGRERQVLGRVGEGLSNAEIADVLQVTEATVKYHISHVLQKLNLRDRLQVAVLAHRCGLV